MYLLSNSEEEEKDMNKVKGKQYVPPQSCFSFPAQTPEIGRHVQVILSLTSSHSLMDNFFQHTSFNYYMLFIGALAYVQNCLSISTLIVNRIFHLKKSTIWKLIQPFPFYRCGNWCLAWSCLPMEESRTIVISNTWLISEWTCLWVSPEMWCTSDRTVFRLKHSGWNPNVIYINFTTSLTTSLSYRKKITVPNLQEIYLKGHLKRKYFIT